MIRNKLVISPYWLAWNRIKSDCLTHKRLFTKDIIRTIKNPTPIYFVKRNKRKFCL